MASQTDRTCVEVAISRDLNGNHVSCAIQGSLGPWAFAASYCRYCFNMAHVGATNSFEDFGNIVVEVDWAAQSAGLPLYDEWQVAPAQGDIVVAGVGTRPVTEQYYRDADMLVVPSTYATFVAKSRPLLQVHHMAMTANGKKVLTATTFMVPEPHVRSIAFRMHIMDLSASNLSIPLVGFS